MSLKSIKYIYVFTINKIYLCPNQENIFMSLQSIKYILSFSRKNISIIFEINIFYHSQKKYIYHI